MVMGSSPILYTLHTSDHLDRRARGLVGSRVDYARCTRLDCRETFPWQTTFASAASVCCQESTFVDRVSTDRGEILFADNEAIDHRYLRCIPATRCSILYDDRDALVSSLGEFLGKEILLPLVRCEGLSVEDRYGPE